MERKAHHLPNQEAQLLLKISQGIPAELQLRYNALIAKRQAENLTEDEYKELLRLTKQVENLEVERVECLAELAQMRGVKLSELMDNLGLDTPAYE